MYTSIHIHKYYPNWFINFVQNKIIIIIKEKHPAKKHEKKKKDQSPNKRPHLKVQNA
jgi:ABC-type molybdate transport system substrate-binding protein